LKVFKKGKRLDIFEWITNLEEIVDEGKRWNELNNEDSFNDHDNYYLSTVSSESFSSENKMKRQ
jgi:hypothetical protein